MKKTVFWWQFIGFFAVSLTGVLLHFVYEWTGSNFSALFSAVNESTWEHLKLIFFPMFLFAVIQSFFLGKEYKNFWWIKLKGTLLGLVLIPVLFYTLNGAFGTVPGAVNISVFFVAVAAALIYDTALFNKGCMACPYSAWAFLGFCLIAVLFWVFTFSPPEIPLFEDPISKTYGI